MPTDYNPKPTVVAPSVGTGGNAQDYAIRTSARASVGADSATLRDTNKFATIGHDQTDAAAIAAAMPKTINVNGSVIGSGSFDSSGVADVVVAAPKP